MEPTDRQLQDTYQQRTRRPAGRREYCPDGDVLTRLSTGELRGSDKQSATDHLADCSDCAAEYKLLSSLEEWAEGVAGPLEIRQRESRRSFWTEALAAAALIGAVGLGAANFWQWRRGESLEVELARTRTAIAQSQTATAQQRAKDAQSSSQKIAELQRTLDELSQPQVNVPIVDLEATGPARGAQASDVKSIELPAGFAFFNVVLNVSDSTMYRGYELRILDAKNAFVWQGEGLRRSAYNTFTIALPARMVPAGRYRLQLYGDTGNGKRLVQQYEMKVQDR